ncbi:hypothetical protein Ae406Ps2_6349c [Pseudonocardia sp. Ae406_Ps2]|uniref:hypothetical protein n=1 Tax=unclassified Pseudonocardia TaxID=2619320 RepID=UPI00094ABFAE|nr:MULTISPECIES: hypothetical protein [unclassified Pseudonocardia]OLL69953.1 hypothetical protein Ae168Ps1_6431 [Pseudonocardia sp. Ae168_Ps1]OLL70006.1 hypothetical protein Ae263Ps1_6398 [Pseudonocardia sp. Ae263_Ps1]OLL89002.1 hypothetical protein Ae356Ps1_6329c [Pseudonocardia sp. Ae356_Ps1]OLL89452.1 hypothetical protein Ae331Ps2_6272c [Pseudonocardia sp. Ae331_Ps2]OLL89909.1 hypothetical protein Ae406Ps2_6349c [Pseudonocardia sp. Ae406_Ps2]
MASKDTGPATDYTDAEEAALEAAAERAWEEYQAGEEQMPERMTVYGARVEWAGVETPRAAVRLDRLDLDRVGAALSAVKQANARAAQGEATSYTATGWHSQLRALTGTARGSELADRAGLNPSGRTLRAWLAEDRPPNAANQRAIAEAYSGLRTYGRDHAQADARDARHDAVEAINDAVRERYGADVRFRDVDRIEFHD